MSNLSASEVSSAIADDRGHVVHQQERNRKLKWAILTSLVSRPLALLIPLLVIPIFVRHLGPARYGLFEAIGSLAVWIGLTNLGLGFGLTNRLMDCLVSGDKEQARSYVSTLFFAMSALLTAGGLCVTLATYGVDWHSLFNAPDYVGTEELRWSVWLAAMLPLVGMFLSIAPAVYFAYQELYRQNAWDAAAKLATVAACVSVPLLGHGIPVAIAAMSGVPVLLALLNHVDLWFRAKPWLRPSFAYFKWSSLRGLLQDGILLFLLQSSAVIIFQADRLVIGILRTPVEVAQYGVLNRCFLLPYGVVMLVLMPLWPAYGEAFRRGDIDWCRRKLRLTISVGLGCMFCFGVLMYYGQGLIVRLLTGQDVTVDGAVIIGMTVAFCLKSWADSYSILLNGAGVLLPQVWILGSNAALALAINIAATDRFGILGTVWSFPVAALITSVWGLPYVYMRALRRKRSELAIA